MKIKLKHSTNYRIYTMAKEIKKPLYVWRTYVSAGSTLYALHRTSDMYRCRVSKADFCKAYNTLEITGIHPQQDSNNEFVLFDFYTETLTPEVEERLSKLKRFYVSKRGKLARKTIE